MRLFKQVIATLLLTLFCMSLFAQEPLAIVVHNKNPVEALTRSELIDLFMGKYVAFPNDKKAIPVELQGDQKVKIEFYKKLVGMPLSSVNAYWSRLRFTGIKRVAVFKENEKDVIDFIMENEAAIGYISESSITKDLKVIYILHE